MLLRVTLEYSKQISAQISPPFPTKKNILHTDAMLLKLLNMGMSAFVIDCVFEHFCICVFAHFCICVSAHFQICVFAHLCICVCRSLCICKCNALSADALLPSRIASIWDLGQKPAVMAAKRQTPV